MTLNETVLFDHQNVISLCSNHHNLCKQLVLVLCLYQVIETQFLTTGNQTAIILQYSVLAIFLFIIDFYNLFLYYIIYLIFIICFL